MKKSLIFGALATMLLATSCQEDFPALNAGSEVTVSFNVETPQVDTRAYSDGLSATKLQYAVYEVVDSETKELQHLKALDGTANFDGVSRTTTVQLQLTKGLTYTVVFWAQNPDATLYTVNFDETTASVEVDYNKATDVVCNNEKLDAFFGDETFTVEGSKSQNVKLNRPFAQLNIGTSDYDQAVAAGYTVANSAVTVSAKVYSEFSLVGDHKVLGDPRAVSFTSAPIPAEGEAFPVDPDNNKYLAMNYLLVGAEKAVIPSVTFTYSEDGGANPQTRTYGQIPVQRNYRTNIYGQLLTNTFDVNVTIDKLYTEPANNVEVWDGVTLIKPDYEATTETYTVDNAAELAWIAALVNGTLKEDATRAEGVEHAPAKNIVLSCDVDLAGQEWTPIGNSENAFKGTFNGNEHTVYNLKVSGNNSYVGLFGSTVDGEIKNLTVENAEVSGRLNVGVVAGNPYTSKYTDITVKGLIKVNGLAYVGGVGGKNAYANWTNITVDAASGSYVKANSVENGTAYRTYVGGVVGFNGEGGHSFTNITSNINVTGSSYDVGGLFGIAHYGNKFENCSSSGIVTLTDDNENTKEIGGIAGVWHNQDGTTVTFTNCEFTGKLYIGTEEVAPALVGPAYSATGTGKLIIDGEVVTRVATAEDLKAAIKNGGTVVLNEDLDLGSSLMYANNADNKVTIDLNGHTVKGQTHVFGITTAGTTLTVKNGTLETSGNQTVAVYASGSDLDITLQDVTINETGDAAADGQSCIYKSGNFTNLTLNVEDSEINGPIYISDGFNGGENYVTFKNTTFSCSAYCNISMINTHLTVENCEFTNTAEKVFNPENSPEGNQFIDVKGFAIATYNTKGNAAVGSISVDTKTTFKVSEGEPIFNYLGGATVTGVDFSLIDKGTASVTVDSADELNAAVTELGATVNISAGEYTFPTNFAEGVTLVCEEGTTFKGTSKLNIKGATVVGAKFSNPGGSAADQTINGTFKDCVFEGENGLRWCYAGETVVFEDCVFSGSLYGVHFDAGANDATFKNCTFSGFNAFGAALTLLTLEGCTFVGNGKSGYNGANFWGSTVMTNCEFTFDGTTSTEWIDCIKADGEYAFTNCTVNGQAYTAENYTEAPFNKIESRNDAAATINGTTVTLP